MSEQSYIESFYKPKSADELEIDQLKSAQLSRASRATTIETARSCKSIATSIRSIIDLSSQSNVSSLFQHYDSDSDNHAAIQISHEEFIDDDDIIEFVGTVGGATNSSIGDAVFRALDALITPSVLLALLLL